MKRFKNILFFVDGLDDPAPSLHRAVNLARSNQAHLTLVDVVEPVATPEQVKSRFKLELTDLLVSHRRQSLEDLCADLAWDDCQVSTRVLQGIPFVEVIRLVNQGHFDFLMKVANPPGGINEQLFGGTDLHLFRKCPCPVLIDHPGASERYGKLLAAVDIRDSDQSCDIQILDLATSLAEREQASLDVLHAWSLPGESVFRGSQFHLTQIELDTMQNHEVVSRTKRLNDLLNPYGLSADGSQVHLEKGHATAAIKKVARMVGADLIVMGTAGRAGIQGFFMGNTAEEVLQITHASVLAVKPFGFNSPVR